MNALEILKEEEGFSGTVYQDHLGFDTVGYGTKMPITQYEASMLLEYRLNNLSRELEVELAHLNIEQNAWDVLYLMAYQMGIKGVTRFKNMIKALENQNYERAAREMLDSRWARQTPARANRMADMMREIE